MKSVRSSWLYCEQEKANIKSGLHFWMDANKNNPFWHTFSVGYMLEAQGTLKRKWAKNSLFLSIGQTDIIVAQA